MDRDLYKIHFQEHKVELYLYGRWTLSRLGEVEKVLFKKFNGGLKQLGRKIEFVIYAKDIETVDTSAVFILKKLIGLVLKTDPDAVVNFVDFPPELTSLLKKLEQFNVEVPHKAKRLFRPIDFIERLGIASLHIFKSFVEFFQLFGLFIVGLGQIIKKPHEFKFTSMVFHIQNMTIPALAIVAAVSFMVGAVLTEQAAVRLAIFGAEELVVGFIGMVTARETSILLTGMLVAGRSSSSITAEIGSMRMNEEIDAMQVIGLDRLRFLVMPRVMAMLISLPILTFVAILAGFAGSAVLLNIRYDMPFEIFVNAIYNTVLIADIGTAMVKTPFIAVGLVMVACAEGMKVKNSAASLGHHTTISVVKGLFMVIIIDSVIAIYFTQVNYGAW